MKLLLTMNNEQREKFEKRLSTSRYSVEWKSDNVIIVKEKEFPYIQRMLLDYFIPYISDTDNHFKNKEMMQRVNIIFNLAREAWFMKDINTKYSDQEKAIFEKLGEIINVYIDAFEPKLKY